MQNILTESDFREYLFKIADGMEGLISWEKTLDIKEGTSLLVFNSNPFTLGHRYIAEIASKRSPNVLVLVIQGKPESGGKGNHEISDISFDFEDRLRMTEECLSDLKNVRVIPSGPYIISRDDFPSDFLTDRLGNVHAHAVLDSIVLCHVCLTLGIRTIFAGDEPRDEKSEIHLNSLREECRKSSIVLKVVERKRIGDKYISSAMVRDALFQKQYSELPLLVPERVISYLSGHR